jgi:hypothetical protein
LEQEEEHIKQQQAKLTKAPAKVKQLQKHLAQLAELTKVQGALDALHYKECAKLQAKVASLNCWVPQLKLGKQELKNAQ